MAQAKRKSPDLFTSAPKGKDDYSAKDIEVLEGLEPVRRRPGMYIGGTDIKALHHLAAEVLDNAMDEAVAGHATRIEIKLHKDGALTIRDNGRGIPIDKHPKYKTKSAPFASRTGSIKGCFAKPSSTSKWKRHPGLDGSAGIQ